MFAKLYDYVLYTHESRVRNDRLQVLANVRLQLIIVLGREPTSTEIWKETQP